MHVHLRVYTRVACVYVLTLHTHLRMCVYACGVRSGAHSCTHTCMCVCAWSVRVGVRPCMRACVRRVSRKAQILESQK